jgi:hypothetical protein
MDYKTVYTDIFKNNINYNYPSSVSYEKAINYFKIVNNTKKIEKIADVGSGRGNLIKEINKIYKDKIYSYDLECYYDTTEYNNVLFKQINLCDNSFVELEKVDFLFCLDVLEHLEENKIKNILKTFSKFSNYSFFTIANHSDIIGGVELHLIQKNHFYWDEIINNYFTIINYQSFYDNRLMCYSLETKKEF